MAGIIDFALGGLVGGANQYLDNYRFDRQQQADSEKESRAWDRTQALEGLRQKYSLDQLDYRDELQNAPLQRFAEMMQAAKDEEVPVAAEAPAVKQATGIIDSTRNREADQSAADSAMKASGQTRPRSSQEAVQAALENAKVNDPVAYRAALELYGSKPISVADGAAIIDGNGHLVFQNGSKDDRQDRREDRRDERQNKALAQQIALQQMRDDAAERRLHDLINSRNRAGADGGEGGNEIGPDFNKADKVVDTFLSRYAIGNAPVTPKAIGLPETAKVEVFRDYMTNIVAANPKISPKEAADMSKELMMDRIPLKNTMLNNGKTVQVFQYKGLNYAYGRPVKLPAR